MGMINLEVFETLTSSWSLAFLFAFQTFLLWAITVAVYRRCFHPLATVPGPLLPSITRLYLWYYTGIHEGQYYKKIEQMHAIYGNGVLS